ncbi:uncharacterized protein CANTADRAFT_90114 [Suhomyces tanzawaensis NRRL Y-17324]|uniref:Uncharacterized protein n=1 Tax=Suhomyces tanzawaensis NRRL Y-17324 TaxID=984487 RepID=A0A1E4SHN0_9ASCO|nr:uncharacterized protein CANTADRAFT_90114 [Suhomyces tanzawaensis NRRL Y-17324]ODV79003.1 hypothetical protein CANTADRAFT_90114 [Suhomyces tanzawaensis NRRL Y-17324]
MPMLDGKSTPRLQLIFPPTTLLEIWCWISCRSGDEWSGPIAAFGVTPALRVGARKIDVQMPKTVMRIFSDICLGGDPTPPNMVHHLWCSRRSYWGHCPENTGQWHISEKWPETEIVWFRVFPLAAPAPLLTNPPDRRSVKSKQPSLPDD